MDPRETFLAAVDAVNRGDTGGLERIAHRDVVLHALRSGMTGDYVGHRGLETFAADNAETFEVFQAVYDDFRPLADGRLYAAGKIRIRGRGSHVETQIDTAGIATFRDGLLAGWHDYGDRSAALAAAGLAGG